MSTNLSQHVSLVVLTGDCCAFPEGVLIVTPVFRQLLYWGLVLHPSGCDGCLMFNNVLENSAID